MSNPSLPNLQPLSTGLQAGGPFAKKNEKERRYQQLFPPYHPHKQNVLYFINTSTTEQELKTLCDVVQRATDFIFDTESDFPSHTPALIQILVVQFGREPLPVLLVETKFLPDISSLLFSEIQTLFRYIFRAGSHLYSWGSLLNELDPFLRYQLFCFPICSNIHNVQAIFTGWFNDYLHGHDDVTTADHDDSLVIHAPPIDPELFLPPFMMNRLKVMHKQLWSLQDGIAYIFYTYLSKRDTLRSWSVGLDPRLPSRNRNFSFNYRQRLIRYASYDCLSLSDIMLFMYENHLSNQSVNDLSVKSLGEYFSFLDQRFTSSSSFKTRQVNEVLFDDDSDDSMTVHDLYERHQLPYENQELEQPSDVHQQPQQMEPYYDVNQQQQEIELDYDVNKNYQETDQCLTINQQSDSHQVLKEIISHPEINQHYSPINYYQEIEMDPHSQDNILNVTSIPSGKIKKKRSAAAQQKRNQKTSLRHRKNRYNFEVIRPVNMNIENAKRILRYYAVPPRNVNIVQSTLYIGLKSQDFQDYFEKLLPMDLFI